MNELSKRLKKAIKDSGMSQRELEIKTGIPHSAIQRYASGNTDRVPIGRIELLASALGVSARYLLGWEEAEDNNTGRNIEEFSMLFQQLTKEQQSLVVSQIKGILANQEIKDVSETDELL